MALLNQRYAIIKPLGRGATATVYLASDALYDNALVAIKIFDRKHLQPSAEESLKREFLALCQMEHPNLVRVFDFGCIATSDSGEHLSDPYFTLEYVAGPSLLEATTSSSPEQIAEIFCQLGEALSYIHRCGLIHGDVKPENIIVTETMADKERLPLVKIIDFGFVSTARERGLEELRGTLPYVAPELITGQQFDHRIDLYALGVTLYQVLTRRLPYEEEDVLRLLKNHLLSPPPAVSSIRHEVPPSLAQVAEQLIAKDPGSRPTNASLVSHTLCGLTRRRHALLDLIGDVHVKKVVGREGECTALWSLWSSLLSDGALRGSQASARIAVLVGETGIGKTTILEQLQHMAQVEAVPFVLARSTALRSSAGHLLHQTLKQLFFALVATSADGVHLFDRFRSLFRAAAPELTVKGAPDRRDDGSTGEPIPLNVPDAYVRLLQAAASVRPFALCIDDIDALDEEGQFLLRYAARALADSPVFILLSSESEGAARTMLGPASEDARMVNVDGLPVEGIQEFMELMFGGEAISREAAQRVREEVGGSPYILKEFLSQFAALPLEERLGAALGELERPGGPLPLPKTVQEAYSRVVSSLKPEERYVISAVSCFRDAVPRALLGHLCPYSAARLDHFMTRLINRGILSAAGTGSLFRFCQARFHRYIFENLGEMKLELHSLIARKLEELEGEPQELAFHFHQAGEREQAYRYYLRAAEEARLASAFRERVQFLKEACDLASDQEKSNVLGLLAGSYAYIGQHEEAIALYRSLLTQPALPHVTRQRYLVALGISHTEQGEMDEAEKALLQSASLAQSIEEQQEIEENLATLELARGNHRQARVYSLRVLETLGTGADGHRQTSALNMLGVISFYENKYEEAIEYFRRALDLVERSGKKDTLITVHINLGNVFSAQKRFGDARHHWQLALALCQEVGSLEQEAQIYNNLGIAHYSQQQHAEAVRCYERSLDLFERTGNIPGQAHCHTNLGEVLFAESAYERAVASWERAQHLYEKVQDPIGLTETCNQLGNAYLIIGKTAIARANIDRAAQYIGQEGIESQRGAYYLVNGTLLTQEREFKRARTMLEEAVENFVSAREERPLCVARLRLGMLEESAGREAAAQSILREVAATAQEKNFNDLAAHALLLLSTLAKRNARAEGGEPLALLKQAFILLQDQPVSEITWRVCLNLGMLYRERGLEERAREYLALASSALDHLVSGFTNEDLRSSYLASERRGATGDEIRLLLRTTLP